MARVQRRIFHPCQRLFKVKGHYKEYQATLSWEEAKPICPGIFSTNPNQDQGHLDPQAPGNKEVKVLRAPLLQYPGTPLLPYSVSWYLDIPIHKEYKYHDPAGYKVPRFLDQSNRQWKTKMKGRLSRKEWTSIPRNQNHAPRNQNHATRKTVYANI